MSDLLKEASSIFNELIRMHELNRELLETLQVTLLRIKKYTEKNNIPLDDATKSLLNRVVILREEVISPPFLQHLNQTPKDSTEP